VGLVVVHPLLEQLPALAIPDRKWKGFGHCRLQRA
jgi:hypothetical protein